jgi:hypothetical protein
MGFRHRISRDTWPQFGSGLVVLTERSCPLPRNQLYTLYHLGVVDLILAPTLQRLDTMNSAQALSFRSSIGAPSDTVTPHFRDAMAKPAGTILTGNPRTPF